jgi:hypothetical protein
VISLRFVICDIHLDNSFWYVGQLCSFIFNSVWHLEAWVTALSGWENMLDILLYSWVLPASFPIIPPSTQCMWHLGSIGVPQMVIPAKLGGIGDYSTYSEKNLSRDIVDPRLSVGRQNGLVVCSCRAQICNRQFQTVDERNMTWHVLVYLSLSASSLHWVTVSMPLLLLPEGGLYSIRCGPEMEFLDIINKRLASFAPCYSKSFPLANFKETILLSGFKNPTQENSILFIWISFSRWLSTETRTVVMVRVSR